MATPTYADVINQINTYIIANGNNEITANVLNPILQIITDFTNNNIGDLNDLTTSENETVVASINSLKTDFDNLTNNGVQLYTGYDDPNVTPPPVFTYADFFMQLDISDDSPVLLWQFNGFEWVTGMVISDSFPKGIEYTAVGGETSFNISTTAQATMMFWNGVPQSGTKWSQFGSAITLFFDSPLTAGDFMQFS